MAKKGGTKGAGPPAAEPAISTTRQGRREATAKEKEGGEYYLLGAVLAMLAAVVFSKIVTHFAVKLSTPRETDAFLVSYPKSGNNWLRFMVGHVYIYGKGKESKHWLKQLDFNSIENTIPDMEYGPTRKQFRQYESPRIFKSHQPYAPEAVEGKCDTTIGPMDAHQCDCPNCPAKWKRVVLLVRDGRDVMCSYYHFRKGLRNLEPMDMSFKEFLTHDGYPGYNWAEHVASYLDLMRKNELEVKVEVGVGVIEATDKKEEKEQYNIMMIKYEDLHADAHKVLKSVSEFLGLPHDDDVIQHAIESSSFKKMRALEVQEGLKMFDEEYPYRDRKWRLTRKGKVGSWEECFVDADTKAIFNNLAYPVMKELGYVDSPDW